MAVSMCHQLVGLLGRRIERHRMIHEISFCKRHFFVRTVHRTRRSIDKMLHRIMTASLQNIIETNDIALDIGIRMVNGVPDTCLRR
ncbi:hypothetical protein SDC9_70756 [bioreactor metagenome]|uniref:Transposase DDE domain-containing protein n=1 Tax=bioreactor metagenome TaxID=1076179 RepID=A0A644Y6S8_9ZZZZ